MRKTLEIGVVSLFSVVVLTVAAVEFVLVPYRQNVVLLTVAARTDNYRSTAMEQRSNVAMLEKWSFWPRHLAASREVYLARNYRRLGRVEKAVEAYEQVKDGGGDPLILVEFGKYELELGRTTDGLQHLTDAVLFARPALYEIDDPALQDWLEEQVPEGARIRAR